MGLMCKKRWNTLKGIKVLLWEVFNSQTECVEVRSAKRLLCAAAPARSIIEMIAASRLFLLIHYYQAKPFYLLTTLSSSCWDIVARVSVSLSKPFLKKVFFLISQINKDFNFLDTWKNAVFPGQRSRSRHGGGGRPGTGNFVIKFIFLRIKDVL